MINKFHSKSNHRANSILEDNITKNSCVLIDEPIDGDHRVQATLRKHQVKNIVDISPNRIKKTALLMDLKSFVIMFRAILIALPIFFKAKKILSPYKKTGFFSGSLAAWRNVRSAASHGNDINECEEIYANDLYCGVVTLFGAATTAHIVYESHEVQFHRNRKIGLLRILVELGLEKMILRRVSKLIVSNHVVLYLMQEMYATLPPAKVKYNDFYGHHAVVAPPFENKPSLVYVGKGLVGRLLETLDRSPGEVGAELFIYTLGMPLPKSLSGSFWYFGPQDYEPHVHELVMSRPCIMWCCHENSCLSYTMAVPNKFFQAMALGIPIVALQGTYLAKIIKNYGLGLIYEGGGAGEVKRLVGEINRSTFDEWQSNIILFRQKVRHGDIKI